MTSELTYKVDFFKPRDAAGVVDLYRTVYGENYPVQSVYDTREIIRQEKCHETYRMVARSPDGEIVGHIAVFHSVPPIPNQGLFECGQLMVRPDYRKTPLGFELFHACASEVPEKFHLELWGEAVCNHLFTQQMAVRERFIETALEMDLMPESAYNLPSSQSAGGRVSVLPLFQITTRRPQTLYLPAAYAEFLRSIYEGLEAGSTLAVSGADLPPGTETKGSMELFKEAGVARITVTSTGSNFSKWIEERMNEAEKRGIIVTQVFMPLTVPWTGAAVDILRKRGYFIGSRKRQATARRQLAHHHFVDFRSGGNRVAGGKRRPRRLNRL